MVKKAIGVIMVCFGAIITFFSGLYFSMLAHYLTNGGNGDTIESAYGMLWFFLILAVIGVSILIWGSVLLAAGNREARLYKVLSSDPGRSLDRAAQLLHLPLHKVIERTRVLLRKNYFPGGFIDIRTNCITLPAKPESGKPVLFGAPPTVTMFCEHCGAVKEMKRGTIDTCDYCGCTISGKPTNTIR